MKNLKCISLGIAMLISVLTFGQQKTITGVVTDSSGPLPGVNVVVKGTQLSVATNFDGKYKIQAKVGDKLVYSFLGMNDEIRVVGTSNVIYVKMKDNQQQLQEIIVTGALGIKRKKDAITSSYQVVKSCEISKSANPNVADSRP